jgi:hypothetical protein
MKKLSNVVKSYLTAGDFCPECLSPVPPLKLHTCPKLKVELEERRKWRIRNFRRRGQND